MFGKTITYRLPPSLEGCVSHQLLCLIASVQARDQKTQGNLQLAQECSDKAKWYNILAAGWNLLIPLLFVVLLVLLLIHLGTSQGSSPASFDFFGEDGFQNFMKLFSW